VFPQTGMLQARIPTVPQPLISVLHPLTAVRRVCGARVAADAQNLLSITWYHNPTSKKPAFRTVQQSLECNTQGSGERRDAV